MVSMNLLVLPTARLTFMTRTISVTAVTLLVSIAPCTTRAVLSGGAFVLEGDKVRIAQGKAAAR